MVYVSSGKAAAYYGVKPITLRRWAKAGRVKYLRNGARNFSFWIDNIDTPVDGSKSSVQRDVVIYVRVSSGKQRDDLERQRCRLAERHPEATRVISEVGSSLSFKRRGLQQLLQSIRLGQVRLVICAHRDRVARLAYTLFEEICAAHGTEILVDQDGSPSPTQELADDLLAITHSFSSRMYSQRRRRVEPDASGEQHDIEIED